ncbi:hypothetical protein SAMN07250955_10929 [Arboricoccus pini]|uniref:DUF2332 domain-containing protein n=1 Tax=Arboricoccus pini TaxID=1963835 RepID=A0A212RI18_9PROT|nr:DUF2332 family protein [Arboricoccus pini]SNB72072.1 hypothetical protein SAMN07250955_10929 [Arboricoccus pini]
MLPSASELRRAFEVQADWCRRLGSPFTARICDVLPALIDEQTRSGKRLIAWPGRVDAGGHSLPLRIAGALHALARRRVDPSLNAIYPPEPLPSAERMTEALHAALEANDSFIADWLERPPQTNEVARSSVLMAALQVVAARTGQVIDLYELGSSAGLNLLLDRYAHQLGGSQLGDPTSPLCLKPDWEGPPPPAADVRIVSRQGVDKDPLDVRSAMDRERLQAYVWADQCQRLERLSLALGIAQADPPSITKADAGHWAMSQFSAAPKSGVTRVLMHSITWQYFPPQTVTLLEAAIARAAAAAGPDSHFAWIRYEADAALHGRPSLRLKLWPDGGDELLAEAAAHGTPVKWQASV